MDKKPLMNFKPNYKTTEFMGTSVIFLAIFLAQFKNPNFNSWALSVAISISGYIVARGLFKKNRSAEIGSGAKTSEFYFAIVGILAIGARIFTGQVELALGLLTVSGIWTAYNLSRGHAKSLTPHQTKVHFL
jgi:hypothetical protein